VTSGPLRELATRHVDMLDGRREPGLHIALRRLERKLETVYEKIAESIEAGVPGTRLEEWLLDNRYIIEEVFEQVSETLSPGYLRSLPRTRCVDGVSTSIRVRELADTMIDVADKPIDPHWLERAVRKYQSRVVLTIGELWAIPAFVRLALIEGLVRDACHCLNLGADAEKDAEQEEMRIGEVAGAIISLRSLAVHDWQVWFERLSRVDAILRGDPAGAYARMEFDSRNRYRNVIEELASGSPHSEREIADLIVSHCNEPAPEGARTTHVGYFLVGGGRAKLERELGFRPRLEHRALRLAYRHPEWIYFGLLTVLLLPLVVALSAVLTASDLPLAMVIGTVLLAAVPVTGFAVALLNGLVTWLIPPRHLMKMDFERGIPSDCKSVVVVPVLLSSSDDVDQVFARLEVNYLNNEDPGLVFAVLGDFADADERSRDEDQAVLEHATRALGSLNRRYGDGAEKGPFLFLNRKRRWNPSEACWMGWERKRGKLMEFHSLLAGDKETDYTTRAGDLERLRDVRFIITLDADTLMPPSAAARLVGAMAHPLSQAVSADRPGSLMHGYSILQPRLAVDPDSTQANRFTRIFAGDTHLDLYTHASSDVYHDLFGQGIYAGKGIYDWNAFEYVLTSRVPDNVLLSHDLIEGVHARAGLLSDVVLLEQFPTNTVAYMRRLHRWVRGDWQLLPWLRRRVPVGEGAREPNSLPWVHQWKIIDNLRRSLQPPAVLVLLLLAWTGWLPGPTWVWTLLFAALLGFPVIGELLDVIGRGLARPATLRTRLRAMPSVLASQLEHWLFNLVLLPYQSRVLIDAVARTLFRLLVSRRHLLEWVTAARVHHGLGSGLRAWRLWREMWVSPVLAVLVATALVAFNIESLPFAAPLLLGWLMAPVIVAWYDRPSARPQAELPEEATRQLRRIARRTWLFFDRFTGPDDHWLPPDSLQEEPGMMLARRTSPTNMGMALVSSLAAHDLGYLDTGALVRWLRNSLERMHDLPRYRGHWLNWYSTRDMQPLEPRYVSTVDSGNLAVCLVVLARGLEAIAAAPPDNGRLLAGLVDTLQVMHESLPAQGATALREEIEGLCTELEALGNVSPGTCPDALGRAGIDQLGEHLFRAAEDDEADFDSDTLARLRTWLEELERQADMARRHFAGNADEQETLRRELVAIARLADQAVEDMRFGFLYDKRRHLFHIGYDVGSGTLDANYYDLLASEARLASVLAIAKGEVPVRHWLQLGRPFRRVGTRAALMSWGATLFEYLMPSLFTATDDDSLLGRACHTAIDVHREFSRKLDLPWGVSESGFYEMDEHQQFQYRAFGVPGIGFRRDLGDRLVIAPYASMMALAFNPAAVLSNLGHLKSCGAMGQYGLFEAIDFGRVAKAGPRRARMVRSYMAHHQGMVMLAITNFLKDDVMVRRFHSDPRIVGVSMLLHERLPQSRPKLTARESPRRSKPFRVEAGPETWTLEAGAKAPQYNLLSNGHYSLFLNADGGGGSLWDGIALTPWQPDATANERGPWFYIKDLDSDQRFSATLGPLGEHAGDCSVTFGPHTAEFERRERDLQCRMRVAVSSQHDIEARKLVIHNDGGRTRRLMIVAYAEVALATPAEFERHPAFARLFVESECLEAESILLFRKRPRSGLEKPIYLAHTVLATPGLEYRFGFETERGRFVGRGRNLADPRVLDGDLEGFSGSAGSVLDPVIGSAIELRVPAYEKVEIGWLTGVARSRTNLLSQLRAYRSMPRVDWVFEQAHMQTGQELHNLEIDAGAVREMTELLSALLCPARELRRAGEPGDRHNTPAQLALWARGISGDRPILLVRVRGAQDVGMLEPLLKAHTLWAGRQAGIDLVLLDESSTGYLQTARDRLHERADAIRSRTHRRLAGVVVVVSGRDLPAEQRDLILAAAYLVLDTAQGSFQGQLRRQTPGRLPPFLPMPSADRAALTTPPLLRSNNLLFDNGIGGFSVDGREYVIDFDACEPPPAPWINILANPHFGTQVTETGGSCTWAGNSAEHRLTPWPNDPVSDASGEAMYLRDEETGAIWTPTARPIPSDGPYQVIHGAGYSEFRHHSHGLTQNLRIHVDPEAPVKLSRLSLTNTCAWTRRITVTCYAEWVLGGSRARNAPHIACEFDRETNTLLARNRFDRLSGMATAFLGASRAPHGITADRAEFLGRGGSMRAPAALGRIGLSDQVRPDDDPCAAYQVHLDLAPGEEKQVHFVLGEGRDREQALMLASRFGTESALGKSWRSLQERWNELLDVVQVETPEPAMDLLLNRWLLYQTISSRLWARGGYYQPSGAYGFRDQLQDVMALVWSSPDQVREHLLRAASRQFADGDVLHWWHEQPLRGVRTRCSDDLLWLPYVAAHYLECTGDQTILHEQVPYLEGPNLEADETERYREFAPGARSESLYEHCCRALERAGAVGPHGLPTIGSGDWNDGLNRVSTTGRGESVWLAWFLARAYRDFAPWCETMDESERSRQYRKMADHLVQSVERQAWDGEWYRRAYFDDGTPLGSTENKECRIDLIAQAWSVLAADAPTERARQAMESVWRQLVRSDERLILLLTPPFDRGLRDPGYIKGYPPGIRENGAQYTHAATWAVWAAAGLDNGDGAMELFRLINPILRTASPTDVDRYRLEPYVLAGDVYSESPHVGRGGWSWYSGAAAWLYRAGLEALLGLKLRDGELEIDPCLPAAWPGYKARIRRGKAIYRITLDKPVGLQKGKVEIVLDGCTLGGNRMPLVDDGQEHNVRVRMLARQKLA
jgi:cyclic beta-1,2-glucan synthetase